MKRVFILITSLFLPLVIFAAPKAPSNLKLKALSAHTVSIDWRDNSNNERGFKIFRDGKILAITKPNTSHFIDTPLRPNTTYRYTIKATDDQPLKVNIDDSFKLTQRNFSAPFVIDSNIRGQRLYLLATNHTTNFNSATFKTIKEMIEYHHIDYLIIEGVAKSSLHSSNFLNYVDSQCSDSSKKGCQEAYYSLYLARQKSNIDYTTGAPSSQEVIDHFKQNGYTQNDYFALYYSHTIVGLNRQGTNYSQDDARDRIENRKKAFEQELGSSIDFGYDEYKSWFRAKMHKEPTLSAFYDLGTSIPPISKQNSNNFLQNLAFEADVVRNANIKKQIDYALNAGYSNILVVYGAGHIYEKYKTFSQGASSSMFVKYY